MKKWMTTVAMCLMALCVAGCQGGNMKLWMAGGPDLDSEHEELLLRAGIGDRVEVGGEVILIGFHGEQQAYGVYAFGKLPATPVGVPYIGYHAAMAEDSGDGNLHGPIGGTLITITDNISTVIEYQYRSYHGDFADAFPDENDQDKVYAGLVIGF